MHLPGLRRAEGREIDKRRRCRVLLLQERLQPRAPGAMARAARGGRTGATLPWRGMEGFRGACDLPADAARYVPNVQGVRAMAPAHDFSAVDTHGHDQPLSDHARKVLPVVNVAFPSRLPTPYSALQAP